MDLDIKNNKNLITFLVANFIQLFFGLLIVIQMNMFSPKYLGIFIFQYTFRLKIIDAAHPRAIARKIASNPYISGFSNAK